MSGITSMNMPKPATANLQTRITVAAAAKMMNVSERMVYMCRELMDTGREDMVSAVRRGEMSVLAALKVAKPEKYAKPRDSLKALRRAWSAATEADRATFLDEVAP